MRLLSFLGKNKISQSGLRTMFGRENALVLAVLGLIFIFIGVLVWDVFVFYAVQNVTMNETAASLPARILEEKDIDEITKLLDERARALDALLGASSPLPSVAASSTPPAVKR